MASASVIRFIKFVTIDDNGEEIVTPFGYPRHHSLIDKQTGSENEQSQQGVPLLTVFQFISNHHPAFLNDPKLIGVDVNGIWFPAQQLLMVKSTLR
ncbi:hypothetical protein [Effusibacillus consociatus]|uniref:Uncharacterized protein n=1 Tax=Effusibacillus consociatus TaxID=1117041 RepID=A0ABV9Q7S3_9BACL